MGDVCASAGTDSCGWRLVCKINATAGAVEAALVILPARAPWPTTSLPPALSEHPCTPRPHHPSSPVNHQIHSLPSPSAPPPPAQAAATMQLSRPLQPGVATCSRSRLVRATTDSHTRIQGLHAVGLARQQRRQGELNRVCSTANRLQLPSRCCCATITAGTYVWENHRCERRISAAADQREGHGRQSRHTPAAGSQSARKRAGADQAGQGGWGCCEGSSRALHRHSSGSAKVWLAGAGGLLLSVHNCDTACWGPVLCKR